MVDGLAHYAEKVGDTQQYAVKPVEQPTTIFSQ